MLWISDIYGFLIAGALIPMGAIGDRIGRRRLLLIGSVFFGLASILGGVLDQRHDADCSPRDIGYRRRDLLPSTLAMIRNLFRSRANAASRSASGQPALRSVAC